MATKKKAAKKTGKAGKLGISGTLNLVPFCVQVEHSGQCKQGLCLSLTGNRFPNSVYFMYQTLPVPGNGVIVLEDALGLFVGYPGSGDLPITVGANGVTPFFILDPFATPRPIKWKYADARGRMVGSGGGIIIDP